MQFVTEVARRFIISLYAQDPLKAPSLLLSLLTDTYYRSSKDHGTEKKRRQDRGIPSPLVRAPAEGGGGGGEKNEMPAKNLLLKGTVAKAAPPQKGRR
jgi:hypothetical protein